MPRLSLKVAADGVILHTGGGSLGKGTPVLTREWLDVPFREKEQAKAAGARWDDHAERWYAPRPGLSALARWAARPDLPGLLPGEDRQFGRGLFVDLVPESCWFTNARSCIDERDWERVRRLVVNRAGRRCEVCGRRKDRRLGLWLEAHERWAYSSAHGNVQSLRRLVCLCTWCHQATHMGLAGKRGLDAQAFEHLCQVTGMSAREADQHVEAAFAIWELRSASWWDLDLSILTRAGIALARPASVPVPGLPGRGDVVAGEADDYADPDERAEPAGFQVSFSAAPRAGSARWDPR